MSKKILIIAHDNFEDIELVATRDVLLRKGVKVDLISMTNKINIVSTYGLRVKADGIIKNVLPKLNEYDALFIPGGRGLKDIDETKEIDEIINHFSSNKKIIGTLCAAPIILAKRGKLENINATCYPEDFFKNILIEGKAIISDEEFVIDENIITGRDMKSSIEFAKQLSNQILKNENTK